MLEQTSCPIKWVHAVTHSGLSCLGRACDCSPNNGWLPELECAPVFGVRKKSVSCWPNTRTDGESVVGQWAGSNWVRDVTPNNGLWLEIDGAPIGIGMLGSRVGALVFARNLSWTAKIWRAVGRWRLAERLPTNPVVLNCWSRIQLVLAVFVSRDHSEKQVRSINISGVTSVDRMSL